MDNTDRQSLFCTLEQELRTAFRPEAGGEDNAWRANVREEARLREELNAQIGRWEAAQQGEGQLYAPSGIDAAWSLDELPFGREHVEELRRRLRELDESFSQTILRLIDSKGLKDSECYHRARMSRKLFSKLRIDDHYQPSRETALALAVALELNREETDRLLLKAGFSLSESSVSDVILIYCLNHRIYDLDMINEALLRFGQKALTKQESTGGARALMGAVIGDVAGSRYEFDNIRSKDFRILEGDCEYTDDSIMTLAVAEALMESRTSGKAFKDCVKAAMQRYGRAYPSPRGGYGGRFSAWLRAEDPTPYHSCGNGSAMRVSACGYAAESLEEALKLAAESAEVTHDHPEGVKGAQAVAAAIYLAGTGMRDKAAIRSYISERFYPLDGLQLDKIRESYRFSEICQDTVPQAIVAFLESKNYEDAIRNAISLGGDSDTLAAITGSIAWAYYLAWSDSFPKDMDRLCKKVLPSLPEEFRKTIRDFDAFTSRNFA